MEELFKEARERILSLKDDWDEIGSKTFKESTMIKVEKFLKKLNPLKLPVIMPYTEGSIDLEWENPELLINIPEDDERIPFYGINKFKEEIKGTVPPIKLKIINDFLKSE